MLRKWIVENVIRGLFTTIQFFFQIVHKYNKNNKLVTFMHKNENNKS